MTTDDKIRDEKPQYSVNREEEKISTLLSDKIDKHDYLKGEGILLFDHIRILEQAKFTYSSLGKEVKKQIEKSEDQSEKRKKIMNSMK